MAYSVHIERNPPLTLSEWEEAVEETEGVCLDSSGQTVMNPKTGERISYRGKRGDAQIEFDTQSMTLLLWSDSGSVTFRPAKGFQKADDCVRAVVLNLARRLDARVVGDDGEIYE